MNTPSASSTNPSTGTGFPGLFITGTDTEIGKTAITAGLTWSLSEQGLRVAPIKPLAAGRMQVNGHWINEDVQQLLAAQRLGLSESDVGPCQLDTPCAPHIAARLEDRPLTREALLQSVARLQTKADCVLVEGVGGFRVPLLPGWDTADFAVDLDLPVLLVVGLRLGCINHALLTAEAVRQRGLTLIGWVGNRIDPQMPHVEDNLQALQEGLNAPCWGVVPHLATPGAAQVAAHLRPVFP
jgi:dethiobiotin synthetase